MVLILFFTVITIVVVTAVVRLTMRQPIPTDNDDGARVTGFMNRYSASFKIGVILASLHVALTMFILYSIIFNIESEWPMYWMLLFAIDFPVTLVNFIIPHAQARLSFWPSPFDDINNFWIPLIVHGVFGTLWYFILPILIGKLFGKRKPGGVRLREKGTG